MRAIVKETVQMLEMLPENEVKTINDLVKLLVRSWDSDLTKVTEEERARIDVADAELKNGIYFTEEEVWN